MNNRHPDGRTPELGPSRKLESPGEGFTDRVIAAIYAADEAPISAPPETGPSSKRTLGWLLRPELYNVLVATAATYLFVSTGLLKAVFTVDSGAVEAGLYVRMLAVVDWVGRLAHALPS